MEVITLVVILNRFSVILNRVYPHLYNNGLDINLYIILYILYIIHYILYVLYTYIKELRLHINLRIKLHHVFLLSNGDLYSFYT